jgi:hypothetical protein
MVLETAPASSSSATGCGVAVPADSTRLSAARRRRNRGHEPGALDRLSLPAQAGRRRRRASERNLDRVANDRQESFEHLLLGLEQIDTAESATACCEDSARTV